MRRKRTTLLLSTCLVVASLIGFSLYAVRLCFRGSLYTKAGTIAHCLCVSRVIKNVPPVGRVGAATYYTSPGDGVKPPQDAVDFASETSREVILLEIDRYLTRLDFKRGSDPTGSSDPWYSRGNSSVRVWVGPRTEARAEVRVTQYF